MLNTGCLRPGELRTLQWSEVRDRIHVLPTKAKDKELRRIPIQPELQEVLNRRRKGPGGNDLPADAYVFGDDTGRVTTRERLVRTLATRLRGAQTCGTCTCTTCAASLRHAWPRGACRRTSSATPSGMRR